MIKVTKERQVFYRAGLSFYLRFPETMNERLREGMSFNFQVLDPLRCPACAGTMQIICFIEKCQPEVIKKILRHCGLWKSLP
jgi:hypothetical protein